MDKKYLIVGIVAVLLIGGAYYILNRPKVDSAEITVLRSPKNIIISGDSAKYVGRSQYEIKATVTNNTDKSLVYMPLFGLIRDTNGKKIGLALGNTGRLVKPGETTQVYMDTVIPKELGLPVKVELYSEQPSL